MPKFDTHPQRDFLTQFCDLFQKTPARGDVNTWRVLASLVGIPRLSLESLKKNCLEHFVKIVQTECQEEFARQRLPVAGLVAETSRDNKQPMSLLVLPGNTFDKKILLPQTVVAVLANAGALERTAIVTADKNHYSWVTGLTVMQQWDLLLQAMPPGQQKDNLQRRASKDHQASARSSMTPTNDISAQTSYVSAQCGATSSLQGQSNKLLNDPERSIATKQAVAEDTVSSHPSQPPCKKPKTILEQLGAQPGKSVHEENPAFPVLAPEKKPFNILVEKKHCSLNGIQCLPRSQKKENGSLLPQILQQTKDCPRRCGKTVIGGPKLLCRLDFPIDKAERD